MSRRKEVQKIGCTQEVCVMMNLCPVLHGIVGRCCAAEHQLKSCQQPYVMKLYPCHSMRVRGTAPYCLPQEILSSRSLMENMNGTCWLSFSFLALNRLHLVLWLNQLCSNGLTFEKASNVTLVLCI